MSRSIRRRLSGRDARGEWQTYAFQYYHDGAWWGFDLVAYGFVDAAARLKKLPLAQVLGTVEAEIPAGPAAGVAVDLWCRVKNWLGRSEGAS